MTEQWLCPEHLFDGKRLRTAAAMCVEDGRIVAVSDAPQNGKVIAGCISPGFVDLQVNGGGGVLINTQPEALDQVILAHRRFGTVALMPTVITDAPDVLDRVVERVLHRPLEGCVGLHIEGPHIAVSKRGTHSAAHIRPFDDRTLAAVKRLRAADIPVMITVAPEQVQGDDIRALTACGAIVSLGHTDATAEEIAAALKAGARCGTHVFNAMSQMTARAPGAVGALLDAKVPVGLIADGHHVDPAMIRLALRMTEHAFLVSDAMPTVGGPDTFTLYGRSIRVEEGRLVNDDGNLAGAHTTMADGVQYLVKTVGTSLETALQMAVTKPAMLIGHPQLATLEGRHIDDLVCLRADHSVSGLSTLTD